MGETTDVTLAVYESALARLTRHANPAVQAESADLANEVVARYLTAVRRHPIDNPPAWAKGVADRVAADFIDTERRARGARRDQAAPVDPDRPVVRREQRVNWEADIGAGEAHGIDEVDLFVRGGLRSSAAALQREQLSRVRASLSPRELELVTLYAEGRSAAEIAAIMGYKNAAVVRATLSQLRRRVRAEADALGVDPAVADVPRVY